MKKFLLGTNWKMNKTLDEAITYSKKLVRLVEAHSQYNYFIIPPYTHLTEVKKALGESKVMLGAQNMHWEDFGAYTGEISPKMLSDIGIDLIELGHSERRQYYNENDFDLNKKLKAGLKHNFTPLLCIGEYMVDKEYGITREVIKKQVKIGMFEVSKEEALKVWLAYEPVWAIGENGIPAEPSYVAVVHGYIREQLVELYGEEVGNKIPILYGGSVNAANCVELSNQENVDGLFIGRSAWDIQKFEEIINLLEISKY